MVLISHNDNNSTIRRKVEIRNVWFTIAQLKCISFGQISFVNCTFYRTDLQLILKRNHMEWTKESAILKAYLQKGLKNHKAVKFSLCLFHANLLTISSEWEFTEVVVNKANLKGCLIAIGQDRTVSALTGLIVKILDSKLIDVRLTLFTYSNHSSIFFYCQKTHFTNSKITQHSLIGFGPIGFHIENTIFIDIQDSAIHTYLVFNFYITHSYFKMANNARCVYQGCILDLNQVSRDVGYLNRFGNCRSDPCKPVELYNNTFVGNPPAQHVLINILSIGTFVKSSNIHSEAFRDISTGQLINVRCRNHHRYDHRWYGTVTIEDTVFSTGQSIPGNEVSMISVKCGSLEIKNLQVLCYVGMTPKSFQDSSNLLLTYSCQRHCEIDKYTLEAENVTVNATINTISENKSKSVCYPCPVGATCTGHIRSLPNYWGYYNKKDQIAMIRCPDKYCCQDYDSCIGISGCSQDRTGMFCGTCKDNFTVSLFSANCIPNDVCYTGLVLTVYFLAALGYTVALFSLNTVKATLHNKLKKIWHTLKNKIKNRAESQLVGSNSQIGNEDIYENHSNEIKYLQIMFFYIQDAELFKVKLPSKLAQEEHFLVKLFQISPEIVLSIYSNISDICFLSATTNVTKVWLKTLFGPCVMLFISLFYIVQLGLSRFKCVRDKGLKSFRGICTKTFILVYLLTFQQIIKGTFTLAQCVEILDKQFLYIQGAIECYQWWQVLVQTYILTNLIPSLFVLSSFVFPLKQKKILLKLFLLTCIMPIPMFLLQYLKCLKRNLNGMEQADIILTTHTKGCSNEEQVRNQLSDIDEDNELSDIDEDNNIPDIDEETQFNTDGSRCNITSLGRLRQKHVTTSSSADIGKGQSFRSISDIGEMKERKLQKSNCFGSRDQVLQTLLLHYKTLKLFGVKFTWLLIHKLYRVLLVACNTYITDLLSRIYTMTLFLIFITVLNTLIRPYKSSTANATATMSYAANICIALVSIAKSGIMIFDCRTNCSYKHAFLSHLDKFEDILLMYIPVVAMCLFCAHKIIKTCMRKKKNE